MDRRTPPADPRMPGPARAAGAAHRRTPRERSAIPATPRRRRISRTEGLCRLSMILGTVLVLISGGSLVGIRLLVQRYTGSVQQQRMLGEAAAAEPAGRALTGALNVLLIGVDERTEQSDPDGTRADSIMIIHVDAAHEKGYLLSIPRDTLTDIPAFARTGFTGSREKINAAFQHGSSGDAGRAGGFELLADTVHNMTGISFNAGAIINFAGFRSVVEALGGVDLCVDQRVVSYHLNTAGGSLSTGGTPQVYLPGCQHLLPWQALDFARQRYGLPQGDYDRQRHQQQLVKAIGRQALSRGLSNPAGLDKVLMAGGRALTVDVRGAGLTDWLVLLRTIGPAGMTMLRTNAGAFTSVTCPDGSDCEDLTEDSLAMFDAARTDTVAGFVASHPTWVTRDPA